MGIYKKKNFIRSIFRPFLAVFAQRGVLRLLPLLRGHYLDCEDAVCCACFRIISFGELSARFFRFLPHFSKKLRSIPMIYFFEKKKNEKNEKMDDTGSHNIVAPC